MAGMHIEVPEIAPDRILPEPEDVCPDCQGRGWKVVADGGAGTAQPCGCREKDVVPTLIGRAGIPERYEKCTLGRFNTDNPDPKLQDTLIRALRISQQYVERFINADGSFCESGQLYIGRPGLGKTHLAAAVLRELIQRYRVHGRFVDFTSLIHQIQATFDVSSLDSKRHVIDPVIDAEVLVFDELGAQKPTEWVRDTLYLIINTRYTRRLPTIFTTNYPLERGAQPVKKRHPIPGSDADVASIDGSIEAAKRRPATPELELLESRISDTLVSRLYQMAQPIVLGGVDYRRDVLSPRIGS